MRSQAINVRALAVSAVAALGVGMIAGGTVTGGQPAHADPPPSYEVAPRTPLQYVGGTANWYNAARSSVPMPQFVDWDADGVRDVFDSGTVFLNSGTEEVPVLLSAGIPLGLPTPAGYLTDWDWDGDQDFLSRYTLHLYRNTGSNAQPTWVDAGELTAGGQPMSATFTGYNRWNLNHTPSIVYDDWDGDGDRDLILGAADRVVDGSNVTIIYTKGAIVVFENLGSDNAPVFASGQPLQTADGQLNAPFKPMIDTADWDGDGDLDVLYGDYIGDVWFVEREGDVVSDPVRVLDTGDIGAWLDITDRDADGDLDLAVTSTYGMQLIENVGGTTAPALESRGYVQTDAAGVNVRAGLFQTPYAVDWEGDGDLDLVAGDENGRVNLFENVAVHPSDNGNVPPGEHSPGPRLGETPQLVNSVPVVAGGEPINLDADDAIGSWEWGPSEAAAGYTNPVVVDWDGDGDLDIITQDAQEATLWYFENAGTRSEPTYRPATAFQLDGEPFTSPWRCRVAVMDWDDDGDLDLVQHGPDNALTVYTRGGSDESLTRLTVAQNASGQPVTIPSHRGGRTNLQAVDWDNDGLVDLVGSTYGNRSLFWMRNVGSRGEPVFQPEYIRHADRTLYQSVSNHTPKTFAVDWNNDRRLDLLDVEVTADGGLAGAIQFVDGAGLEHKLPRPERGNPGDVQQRRFEAESMPVSATSGDRLTIFVDPAASGDGVLQFEASAIGDFVGLFTDEVAAGNYDVVVGVRVAPNRAIVQTTINGSPIGDPIDAHSASAGYREFPLGQVTMSGAGNQEIRFSVTGRNAASRTYAVYVDYIDLIPVEPES